MDSIIDVDEQVRKEIDRKCRLENLKLRNQEEVKQSSQFVKILKNEDKSMTIVNF